VTTGKSLKKKEMKERKKRKDCLKVGDRTTSVGD
jgi:hypothetical protein